MASIWELDPTPVQEINKTFLYASRNKLDNLKQEIVSKNGDYSDIEKQVNGLNTLHIAAKKGHILIVEYLLSIHPRLCLSTSDSSSHCKTAAMIAAFEGHVEIVKLILEAYENLSTSTSSSSNSSRDGVLTDMKVLTNTYSSINESIDSLENTVLHYACWGGHTSVVTYLIESMQLDHTRKNVEGLIPIQMAAAGNFVDIVKYLSLLSINRPNLGPSSDMDQSTSTQSYINIAVLDESVAGFNSFHRAVQNNSLETVIFLLQNDHKNSKNGDNSDIDSSSSSATTTSGLLVDTLTADGSTALHIVCKHGYIEICKHLLQCGANVNIENEWDLTAMHYASIGGYTVIVNLLLSAGVTLHCIKEGSNARPYLHTAAHYGRHEVVELIINHECFLMADLLSLDNYGNYIVISKLISY